MAAPSKLDLAVLLSPIGVESFVQSSWAKAPLFVRAPAQDRFDGLLDLARFEFLLTSVAAPAWVSFLGGGKMPAGQGKLTIDGTPNMAAILKAAEEKKTLLLINLHRLDAGIGLFCRGLTEDFRRRGVALGKPVRANAYFTPPRAQGLEPHYDDHDVLVLQISGTKRWRIHHEVKWPRRPMAEALPREYLKAQPMELTLAPGDVLYLPRGFVHEAAALDSASLHLTLSLHAATWADVFTRLVEMDEALGEPLPVGFGTGDAQLASDKEAVARFAARLGQGALPARAMEEVLNRNFAEGDMPSHGQLGRIGADVRIAADAWLVLAEGVFAKLEQEGGAAVLRVPGGVFSADPRAADFFAAISSGKPFRLCDLDGGPNIPALIVLAQELMKRGVLRMA